VLHRPTFLPIPRVGPKLLLGAELAETLLYEGQLVLPDRLLEAGYEFRFTDLEPALADVLR
jgi:NAD dependent epimerase/dehydratase family enzyme